MIRKSLLTAFILLLLHALVVYIYPVSSTQYSSQENTIKAQQFIYGGAHKDIIIGSSLSNRLVMDSLRGISNLSFSGNSIFDGLSILNHSGLTPRTVFIETNIMSRGENVGFTSYVNSPILNPIKRAIPSLRDEFQPIGMVGEFIIRTLGKRPAGTHVAQQAKASEEPRDDAFFKTMLALQAEDYNEVPDTLILQARFEQLAREVHRLEAKGARIIFFEMPVNETVCDLPEPQMIRTFYRKYFPENKYAYIRVPGCAGYQTTDGAHLADNEAARFTRFFKTNADALLTTRKQLPVRSGTPSSRQTESLPEKN